MMGLNAGVVVYTPNGTDGNYTVLAHTLTCRLAIKPPATVEPGGERVEQIERRVLLWDEAYEMPIRARVKDDNGVYWEVVPGSYAPMTGLGSEVVYRRCEVVKVV